MKKRVFILLLITASLAMMQSCLTDAQNKDDNANAKGSNSATKQPIPISPGILDTNPSSTMSPSHACHDSTCTYFIEPCEKDNCEIQVIRSILEDASFVSKSPSDQEIAEFTSHGDSLNLAGLGIEQLPPEIGKLKNITKLFLGGNQFTYIPAEIGNLTELSLIDCGWSYQLSTLPPEIKHLTKLTELQLYVSGITSLPPEIGALKNLDILNLSENKLKTLPLEITQLTLTELTIDKNQLKPENLAAEVIAWLNKYDPDWESKQN
jgi:Leucine-rich repeat (LRR) protein